MEIVVEVGDETVKQQITGELEYLLSITRVVDPPVIIHQVIVPLDFDATVNRLQETKDYRSNRGSEGAQVSVMAKIVEREEGTYIVLQSLAYLSNCDTMTRCFFLFHEIAHLINKNRFPPIPTGSFSLEKYLGNLYIIFDEYFADRLAFQITENVFSTSEFWAQYNRNGVSTYLDIAADPRYYEFIKTEIERFREHSDVTLHCNSIFGTVHIIAISTAHGFAQYHQHLDQFRDTLFPESMFFNQKTFALMDYFKTKYENSESDLSDGLELIKEYFTNFGIRFEDRQGNGYITVLDI